MTRRAAKHHLEAVLAGPPDEDVGVVGRPDADQELLRRSQSATRIRRVRDAAECYCAIAWVHLREGVLIATAREPSRSRSRLTRPLLGLTGDERGGPEKTKRDPKTERKRQEKPPLF